MTNDRFARRPFQMLSALFADPDMARVFSEEATVQSWLDVEGALATAEAHAGLMTIDDAQAIARAAVLDNVDLDNLWDGAREVGYPILPLVRMIAAALPEGPNGRVHYGATTQDVMDTGLALQLGRAFDRLEVLVSRFGDTLVALMQEHRHTVIAARTHGQQAVPTTFGNKLGVYITELARHRERMRQARPRVCVVSLFGAGGTSAALGDRATTVRRGLAEELDLTYREVPWHVSRDSIAEFGLLCGSVSGTCARFAREVIDLSRTEIGELGEATGGERGASSTMPQKANPIGSESVVGMAAVAASLPTALLRAMEAGHERAAGEWHIEWEVVPQLACLAAGCLRQAGEVAAGLEVDPEAMGRNISAEGGLLMSEAYMFVLAPNVGRERSHDIVRDAALEARRRGISLEEGIREVLPKELLEALEKDIPIMPESYVGDPDSTCERALESWRKTGARERSD
jgi:3-carboxy-cis,cis-muconate cycloisomerase